MRIFLFFAVFSLSFFSTAFATETSTQTPESKVFQLPKQTAFSFHPELQIFTDWTGKIEKSFENDFDVTRAQIGGKFLFGEKLMGRIVLDVAQATDIGKSGPVDSGLNVDYHDLNGSRFAYLRYAYMKLQHILPNTDMQLGQFSTPWIDYLNAIEGTRFLAKTFLDQSYNVPSSDLGVALLGNATRFLHYQVGIYNGEGFTQNEVNKYKDISGRVVLFPFAAHSSSTFQCLGLIGYGQYGVKESKDFRHRIGTALFYRLGKEITVGDCSTVKEEILSLNLQYLYGKDGSSSVEADTGLSAGLRWELPYKTFVIMNYRSFHDDKNSNGKSFQSFLGAFGHHLYEKSRLALVSKNTVFENSDDEHSIGLNFEFSY